MMDPLTPGPRAKTTLTTIPLEVRVMIFKLVLTARFPFLVTRRKNRKSRSKLNPAPLHALLLVNKQLYTEACPFIYKLNTFTLGNNQLNWGSRRYPNMYGLKQFTSGLSAARIASITSVEIRLYLDNEMWYKVDPAGMSLKHANPLSNLLVLVRTLVKHFTGLRSVKMKYYGMRVFWPLGINHDSGNLKALKLAVNNLLLLQTLKNIELTLPMLREGDLSGAFGELETEAREKGKSLSLCNFSGKRS
jgi:hypothetical protein